MVLLFVKRALYVGVVGAISIVVSFQHAKQARATEPTFRFLGTPLGSQVSVGRALSGDGSTVVGLFITPTPNQSNAYRWTSESGMMALDPVAPSTYSSAAAVSGDGSVVVGENAAVAGAFRWTASSGMQALPMLPNTSSSEATGVSADGSVVSGSALFPTQPRGNDLGYHAARWTASGEMQDLGVLPSGYSSKGRGLSADGSTVVGEAVDASGNTWAMRWTLEEGIRSLGALEGTSYSRAFAASADGSVVVGYASTKLSTQRPFRWTAASGMQDLGTLDSDPRGFGSASDVSWDGTTIVGYSSSVSGPRPFIWTPVHGMRDLQQLLGVAVPPGVNLGGDVKGISADGFTIVGDAYNPSTGSREAWIATIPEPATFGLIVIGGTLAARRRVRR